MDDPTLRVTFPPDLYERLRELAEAEGISMNQFVVTAVAEKLSALWTEDYLSARAARASRANYEAVLARVPDVAPAPEDRLPEGWGPAD